jgi:type IV pilus assembly protein PilB
VSAIQNNDRYIGDLLVKDGVITDGDLERGLEEQKKSRDFLCTTLVRLGLASEEKIFSILSLQIGVPYLSLKELAIDPFIVNRLPGRLAASCRCLPVKEAGGTMYVAMADPLNSQVIDEVRSYLGVERIKVFLAGDNDLKLAHQKYYNLP